MGIDWRTLSIFELVVLAAEIGPLLLLLLLAVEFVRILPLELLGLSSPGPFDSWSYALNL